MDCCSSNVKGNQRGNTTLSKFVVDTALSKSYPSRPNSSSMGRSATKSVARVYCDVNNRLGSSWYEYGTISHR